MLDNQKEVYALLKKNDPSYLSFLNVAQLKFLFTWWKVVRKVGKEGFGFKDVIGLEEQVLEAKKYYVFRQQEWQNKYLNGLTEISFMDYFISIAKESGLDLPENFKDDFHKKTEELENEQ